MRNLPWEQASAQARRTIDIKNYNRYNDVWMPKDLSQGDIIRCDLLTDINQNGDPEIRPRNCLLLGIDLNQDTLEIEALRVLRFSYFTRDNENQEELVFHPHDAELRGKITGFRDQVVLRTKKVDVVPVDSGYLGFYLDRIGHMHPSLFGLVNKSLQQSLDKGKLYLKFHEDMRAVKSVHVPSLSPERFDQGYPFKIPHASTRPFAGMEAKDKESFLQLARIMRLSMDIERVIQVDAERKVRADMTAREKEEQLALRRVVKALNKPFALRLTKDFEQVIDDAAAHLQRLEEAQEKEGTLISGTMDPAVKKLKNIPDYRSLLRAHFGIKSNEMTAAAPIIIRQSIDPSSLADLETLGIGGLLREPTVQLPDHLWRGRYVMMRIPDLLKPENVANAYRPCAIWKAYAKPDIHGDPVLAGLELHPCTREEAHAFNFRMKVRPLETTHPQPSFLIADMVIRAPVNATYFQPSQRDDLHYDLLPNQIRDFEWKRGLAEQSSEGIKIFGLPEVPADWIEVQLPEAPNERLREKLVHWNHARFQVGTTAIRSMGKSRGHAPNFRL